jgi:hypothetical protein
VQHPGGGHGSLPDAGEFLLQVLRLGREPGVVALRPEPVADLQRPQRRVLREEPGDLLAVPGQRDDGVVAVDGGVRVEDD